MSDDLQSLWAKLAGFIVGYQATWIADIGLKAGLFQAELPQLLHTAGFTSVRVADQPMATRFVMLADKPA